MAGKKSPARQDGSWIRLWFPQVLVNKIDAEIVDRLRKAPIAKVDRSVIVGEAVTDYFAHPGRRVAVRGKKIDD